MHALGKAVPLLVASALAIAGCGGSDGSDEDGGSESASPESANERLFSSSGFGEALDAAAGSAGDDAEVISIEVTDGGAEFSLLGGTGAQGLIYTNGELSELEVAVVGSGPKTQGFPLSQVDAGAVDAMVAGLAQASGAAGLEISALTLEPDRAGNPRWTITAKAGAGENLTYRAKADGSNLRPADDVTRGQPTAPGQAAQPGAAPNPQAQPAPSVEDAQAALECVQAAEGDVAQLQKCAALIQP